MIDELDIAIKAVRAYAEMHPRSTQVNQAQIYVERTC